MNPTNYRLNLLQNQIIYEMPLCRRFFLWHCILPKNNKHKLMKFNTKTIHGGQEHDKAYGAVMPPIYQTSTYVSPTSYPYMYHTPQ